MTGFSFGAPSEPCERRLDNSTFFRASRGCIVNLSHVKQSHLLEDERLSFLLNDGKEVVFFSQTTVTRDGLLGGSGVSPITFSLKVRSTSASRARVYTNVPVLAESRKRDVVATDPAPGAEDKGGRCVEAAGKPSF